MAGGRHVVVLAGGDPVEQGTAALLPDGAYVVAADSGLAQAELLGLDVDVAVGDFDSVDPALLAAAADRGCVVARHPVAKDQTDLELALQVALEAGAERITVVGGHGGRFDHELANVALLTADHLAAVEVDAVMGRARLAVVRHRIDLAGQAGELVSLLPVGGPAGGVRTEGLRYPLHGEDLPTGTSRGVSNVMTGPAATVSVASGVVLVVRPG